MVDISRDFKPGIRFKSFKVRNGRVFDNLTLPLTNQGIVSILGENGAGKSTIWNLLEATAFASTPDGHKKDDLVKNLKDASFELDFEKATVPHLLVSERKKKKWGYRIEKDGKDQTPHTYNDSVKAAGSILGINQAEFEGSIHLTQGAQHILISEKPAKRKEYISNFFGIDTSYDLVHQESKIKLQETKDQITKLSALSHTKGMLEQEIELENYQDPKDLELQLNHYESELRAAEKLAKDLETKHEDLIFHDQLSESANKYDDPEDLINRGGEELVTITSQLMSAATIKEANKNALEVNRTILKLQSENEKILENHSQIDTFDLSEALLDSEKLVKIKTANETVEPLRKELASLPDRKALPIEPIEKEVNEVWMNYQTAKKKAELIRKGECGECGAKFESTHLAETEALVADLEETYQILGGDLVVIKERNTKAQRRQNILKTLTDIPEWDESQAEMLKSLREYIPAKRDYQENNYTLGILQKAEILEEVDTLELSNKQQTLRADIADYKVCLKAKSNLPEKPEEPLEIIVASLTEAQDRITKLTESKLETAQELGKVKAGNIRVKRLQNELITITQKLSKVEGLKKEEFYWAKLVDAYGPRGLRVRQLEKMMNLVIRRLPVYTSILFNERGLTFKHRCDASSVEIIACREETDADGTVTTFEHDISSFSGGEKGKMSMAFVLTLADCVPPAKRSNILILDEVDSALDSDGQFRFTNDLLPMLKENYESVFVVSHSQEIQQAAVYDQVWVVQKKNHWSEVVKQTLDF